MWEVGGGVRLGLAAGRWEGQAVGVRMRVIAAGRPASGMARLGVEEYARRLARHGGVELVYVKGAGGRAAVSRALLARSEGCFRVALDERGEQWTTAELAGWLDRLALRGDVKALAFLVGAADGHSDELRGAADAVVALSRLTLQHELALVVLLEQLYRVADLRRGGPYHRG